MGAVEPIVAALPSISLQELLDVAALLNRTDRKYVVTATQLQALLDALTGDVRALEVDGLREFGYESMYFDTPEHHSYRAAAHRRRRRFKVRTRSYLDTQQTFLEVKVRDARRRTMKLRTPYAFAERMHLDAQARAFVRQSFEEHGIPTGTVATLAPTLHTEFRRSTLFIPSAGCRLTVDTDISVSHPSGEALVVPDLIVLETKSDAHDRRVDRMLWRLGVRPETISKFAIGSALLDPDLPDNKWSRTIARHFAPAAS